LVVNAEICFREFKLRLKANTVHTPDKINNQSKPESKLDEESKQIKFIVDEA